MAVTGVSQRDMAGWLGCSQSRVAKLLNGRVGLGVDDLEILCRAVGVSPTEAVRDRGLEFVADMKPTELRLLELFRRADKGTEDAIMFLLRRQVELVELEKRGATPKRQSVGKPRNR